MEEPHHNPSDDELRALLRGSRTIAMVGASSKPDRPSHGVMKTLLAAGFRVIPVTPREEKVLGRTAYPSLRDIPDPVDIVDVFRRAEETPAVVDEAVKIGAKAIWLQLGISNEDAANRAKAAGLIAVMDACIGRTVQRLGIKLTSAPIDPVTEASEESFPASDAPSWSRTHLGTPDDA